MNNEMSYEEIDAMIMNDIELSEEEFELLESDEEFCEEFFKELAEMF